MIADIKIGTPTIATVQKVGNKTKEEGITFTTRADDVSFASEFISSLIKNTFKFDVFCQFDSIESLDLNLSYRFVRNIFNNKDDIVKQSNNLARHLYDQSIHPNISNGEFYVIYIKDCILEHKNIDALLLLKTEAKDSFLTVSYENGEYFIRPHLGLSTKHLDKGCLIFNTQPDEGYLISIVETSTVRQDGRYWSNNFLYVKDIITDFQYTENIVNFCSSVVQRINKENPEKSLEMAKASRRITQMLQNGIEINTNKLISSLMIDDEITSILLSYQKEYEDRICKMPETFRCIQSATKQKKITKANVLKIGTDFEIKILNPSAIIEQGYDDEKKKNCLKLYY